jgi:tetratricopeptide (TPR) repeat protein
MRSAGSSILTRGIVEVIRRANDPRQMSPEMINWLVYRQHDLIEDTIERLLDGEDLGEASKPWRRPIIKTNMPKITFLEAVEFINKNVKEFFEELKHFSSCWKRAALIIGYILTGDLVLPDKEKFSDSEVVDVLNYCDVDDYLLVGNKIPFAIAITYILSVVPYNFLSIFADEYENAIKEAKKLLEIWRKREGKIYEFEARYALGLASIVADAARLGKTINEYDADVILKTTSTAVKLTIHPIHVRLILEALEPLRDKAPQRYLEILAQASQMELDKDTAEFIYDELNYILSNFFNKLSELDWPLVTAMQIYSNIRKNLNYYENYYEQASVLIRLIKLSRYTKVDEVKPKELIDVYKDHIYPYLLPALKLALGIEASIEECEFLEDHDICRYAFLAVKGNSDALTVLKNSLSVEILKLVQGLDGKALVQLLAPMTWRCRLALMLYALVSGNVELVKKHAQLGSEVFRGLLVGKLFGDVYEACCDANSERFKWALLQLYLRSMW